MRYTKKVDTWDEFKLEISELIEKYREIEMDETFSFPGTIYFRGQSNSDWLLESTLYRKVGKIPVNRYFYMIRSVSNEIRSYSEPSWQIPSPDEIFETGKSFDEFNFPDLTQKQYSYMVYLRHFGFPSPLLDWSKSPFIAAFFAFLDVGKEQDTTSVLVHIDQIKPSKANWVGSPMLIALGPNIYTHKRHWLQQAVYTVGYQYDKKLDKLLFSSHEDVYRGKDKDQDILYEFILPVSERGTVLDELMKYNINPFTLFQTEDSLVQKVALEKFMNYGS